MNTPSDFETRASFSAMSPLQSVLTTSLAQEATDVVRHLGRVLDLKKDEHVLLIPGDGSMAALTLVNEYGCRVSVLADAARDTSSITPADERITLHVGSLTALPFEPETFDAVIVAVPVASGLQNVARDLARVLKRSGRLGMVALSLYRDQVVEEAGAIAQQFGSGQIRPAAAYRAVLAEAGFTAFLSEDRRRALRRSAQAIYREHMLEAPAPNTATLGLLAAGGISMTLLTAEKGI